MVIGVHGFLAAELASQHLDGSVANDLVYIHVRLRPGPSLPHHKGEVIIQLPFGYLQIRRLQ